VPVLLGMNSVTLTLGGRALFSDVDLQISDGDRVGLVGPNGSGKTSLLRLVAGELEPDTGSIHRRKNLRVGYLPQDPTRAGGRTVLEIVRSRLAGRDELDADLHAAQRDLAEAERSGADNETLLEAAGRLADLHARMAHFEADYADHVALQILAGLGFAPGDENRDIGELSGGWQMRAMLGSLLFMQPDLLLLDEPTNHLDMPSVAWLGDFLRATRRSLVLISHDRDFLNEQIQRVVSFEPEGVRSYAGNYDAYVERRSVEAEVLANRQKNLAREREKAERFIERFRAQPTKARAVQSRIKALERMEAVETLESHEEVAFRFAPTRRTSKQVLAARGLCKAYGDNVVLDDVHLSATRGERIAILGVNGAGKTTLLKVLGGELARDAGAVDLGHHVELGYYAQHHTEMLEPAFTVYEEVARAAAGESPTRIRTLLGSLLLGADDIDKRVAVLSGGEKARVALAKLLISHHNLLLMDEPTNHLDLSSSERLADALLTYDGTLVFVSHNRSFVRKLATRIWNIQDGKLETYPGTLDEYLGSLVRRFEVAGADPAALRTAGKPAMRASHGSSARHRRRRLAEERAVRREQLGPYQKRVDALEQRIAELEEAQRERSAQMEAPGFYDDPERSAEVARAFQQDAARIEQLTLDWADAAQALEDAAAAFDDADHGTATVR
jgi:ATP-binding cassette subfamily F protein 3